VALDQVRTQVLLLHSEQSTLDSLSSGFTDRYTVHCATSGTEALNTLTETPIHVIISAKELPGMSGVEALREAKKRSPETIGILLAGYDDDDVEALVGDKEVFQVVRGNISSADVSKLVDNATQQMRLLALAESANDMAANPDEPVAEHIVMETSENGSTIISDGTGSVPILSAQKISAAAAAGSRAVDVLVLTKDEEFLATVKESSRGMHNIRYANTLAQAEEALAKHKIGVAVVDAAMVGANVEKLTEHLRRKTARLVNIVAGRRDDGEMLMDLINRGKVYRFLLKPVSPGRARLAVEASVKHHVEAPDSAFKISGKAPPAPAMKASPKPQPKAKTVPAKPSIAAQAPKSAPTPTPTRKPAPAPVAKAQPQAKAKAKVKPKPAAKRAEPRIEITASPDSDRLGAAFDGDDTSFTETMTGIVANIAEKFSGGNDSNDEETIVNTGPTAAPAFTLDSDGTDGSTFSNPKILGIGAAAIIAVAALGFWVFSSFDTTQSASKPLIAESAIEETESGPDATNTGAADESNGTAFDAMSVEDIDLALANAEAALLDRRIDDAATEIAMVAEADSENARLPFLMAQLSQLQLREFIDNARVAIRETRLEDAANALQGARALDIDDANEILAVEEELAAARSEQRVDDVLAQAVDRLDRGNLIFPANDNARYYYELVLSGDPENAAAQQGLTIIASKLVLLARTEIDGNRFTSAVDLLGQARTLDPNSDELSAATQALLDAEQRVADTAARREEELQTAARREEADRIAAEQLAENERLAAENRAAAEKLAADNRAAAEKLAEQQRAEDERRALATAAAATAAAAAVVTNIPDTSAVTESIAGSAGSAAIQDTGAVNTNGSSTTGVPAEQVAVQGPDIENQSAVAETAGPQQPPANDQNAAPVAVSTLTRTKYVAPKYPRAAERRSLSGWVDVVFTVNTDGTTKNIEIRDSEPGETFVNAATKAVERWEFMPVFDNGIVIEKRAGIRMMFAIE
jgi:TonB family protein